MDKAALVNLELVNAEKMLAAMDSAELGISVAALAFITVYNGFRLVIASRKLDAEGLLQRHHLINVALRAAGIGGLDEPSFLIMKTTDPFIRDLKRAFGKTKDVCGARLGGQSFGDWYVEDGIVYRIS